jgi:UTP--glucose-1-phosphate uridylyltransferase
MGRVLDAVIVAAGMGTRMLPVSGYVAKEMLPLVDVPVMHHLILEARAAGCNRIHIITSPTKDFSALLDDMNSKFPSFSNDESLLNPVGDAEYFIHYQNEQLGLAHAISMASSSISGPFLILLGDNILTSNHAALSSFEPSLVSQELVSFYQESGSACGAVYDVGIEAVNQYGIVSLDGDKVQSIAEKPNKEDAPSTLAFCGRYIFTEDFSTLLDHYPVDDHGELQSIAIMEHWMKEGKLRAHVLESTVSWYDSGMPLVWLTSQIDHALRRPEYGDQLAAWLSQRLNQS